MLENKRRKYWIYGVSALFLLINSLLITFEFFWFPVIAGVLLVLWFAFFASDKLLMLTVFLTPLSVDVNSDALNLGIFLPSEALMILLSAVFLLKILIDNHYDLRVIKHPVTVAIFIYLIWIFFTSILSEFPIVSFKFLATRLWFIITFYFYIMMVFKRNLSEMRQFILLYAVSLAVVVFYTIYSHSTYGFDRQVGHWVMRPFYNDHTSYGAALAIYTIALFALLFENKYSRQKKLSILLLFVIIAVALFLSYSRAAWLSVVVAIIAYFTLRLKVKYYWIVIATLIMVGGFFAFEHEIMIKLNKNKQDSSTDFVEHVQSISNISTDASNLERLNRWASAFKLFQERPIVGWGPGTYQFVYAPFQNSRDRTIISTNAGDGGNAHSEYIGPLAEAGVVGLLSLLGIIFSVLIYGRRNYFAAKNKEIIILNFIALLGLISYYIHGFLNNFLDTDKLSVPFWGLTAMIVAINIFHLEEEKPKE